MYLSPVKRSLSTPNTKESHPNKREASSDLCSQEFHKKTKTNDDTSPQIWTKPVQDTPPRPAQELLHETEAADGYEEADVTDKDCDSTCPNDCPHRETWDGVDSDDQGSAILPESALGQALASGEVYIDEDGRLVRVGEQEGEQKAVENEDEGEDVDEDEESVTDSSNEDLLSVTDNPNEHSSSDSTPPNPDQTHSKDVHTPLLASFTALSESVRFALIQLITGLKETASTIAEQEKLLAEKREQLQKETSRRKAVETALYKRSRRASWRRGADAKGRVYLYKIG